VLRPRAATTSRSATTRSGRCAGKDKCTVEKGQNEDADCFFKASKTVFLDVWNGKHVPTATDFLLGRIKSNNPMLLKDFVKAFQKSE